jgi:L-rhamnose-H+ transport protein
MLFWIYIFGGLWGFGALTFSPPMRYLGMSLRMAVLGGLWHVD